MGNKMQNASKAQTNMILSQIMPAIGSNERVVRAFLRINRESFVPASLKNSCYRDDHIKLSNSRQIMAPILLASMIEAAQIKDYDSALLIGSGSGYEAAVIASIAKRVVALESDEEAARSASLAVHQLQEKNCIIVNSDYSYGYSDAGLYDLIFINGSVNFINDHIFNQLSDGGKIICVLSNNKNNMRASLGDLTVITKNKMNYSVNKIMPVNIYGLPGFSQVDECLISRNIL